MRRRCRACLTATRAPLTEGLATRVYARINEDGTLSAAPIPDEMREALTSSDVLQTGSGAPAD